MVNIDLIKFFFYDDCITMGHRKGTGHYKGSKKDGCDPVVIRIKRKKHQRRYRKKSRTSSCTDTSSCSSSSSSSSKSCSSSTSSVCLNTSTKSSSTTNCTGTSSTSLSSNSAQYVKKGRMHKINKRLCKKVKKELLEHIGGSWEDI